MTVTIKGIDRAKNALKNIEQKQARKVLSKALRAGTKIVQKEVLSTLPKQNSKKVGVNDVVRRGTGQLRKSIKVRTAKGNNKKGYVRYRLTTKDGPAFYALFLEKGTRYIKARHFMKRAADRVDRRVRSEVANAIANLF